MDDDSDVDWSQILPKERKQPIEPIKNEKEENQLTPSLPEIVQKSVLDDLREKLNNEKIEKIKSDLEVNPPKFGKLII